VSVLGSRLGRLSGWRRCSLFVTQFPHDPGFGCLAGWFAQRVQAGEQATKCRISKNVRAFLKFAFARGYTKLDLETAIEVFVAGGSRRDWLEWSDVHALISAIPEFRYRFAATWLFWTGCRVSEAIRATQTHVRWRGEMGMFEWTIPDSKTHQPRTVWLSDTAASVLWESRDLNSPDPSWPILWDCEGRGFSRLENPACRITQRTINNALERAREAISLPVKVTAHVAKHSYCTNWITEHGKDEYSMEKLSRQVGTSVSVLRHTYVHQAFEASDWSDIHSFGSLSSDHGG
jgi:integrase